MCEGEKREEKKHKNEKNKDSVCLFSGKRGPEVEKGGKENLSLSHSLVFNSKSG